jgi:hypothetical protein
MGFLHNLVTNQWLMVFTGDPTVPAVFSFCSDLFARVYLIFGGLLTFPSLPDGVFKQMGWSFYVPHVSQ